MTCHLITASAFAGFLASAALAQPVAPCLTAGPTCTEWVVLGGGPQRSLIYRSFALAQAAKRDGLSGWEHALRPYAAAWIDWAESRP